MTIYRSASYSPSGNAYADNCQRQWRFGYSSIPVVSNTYSTWNPADKSSDFTLSNGNLSFSHLGTWSSMRATIGKMTGKHYFELTTVDSYGAFLIIGVGSSTAALGNFAGSDVNAWTYYGNNGNKINSGSLTAYGAVCTDDDILGVAVDLDVMTMTIYINGASQGDIDISSLSGNSLFPIVSAFVADAFVQAVVNFGASAFTYAPPAGYNSGWYE